MNNKSLISLVVSIFVVLSSLTSSVTSQSLTTATVNEIPSENHRRHHSQQQQHHHHQLTSSGSSQRSASSSKQKHRTSIGDGGDTHRSPLSGDRVMGQVNEQQDRIQRAAHEQWLLEQTKQRILYGLGRFAAVSGGLSIAVRQGAVTGDESVEPRQLPLLTPTVSSPSSSGRIAARQKSGNSGLLPAASQPIDIILNAEIAPVNSTTSDEVQFRLGGVGRTAINIISATMHLLVHHRKRGNATLGPNVTDASNQRQKPNNPRGHDRGRRITIYVYQVTRTTIKPDVPDVIGTTESSQPAVPTAPIAQLTANIHRSKMQRLLLPTTVVQGLIDSNQHVLRLRVVCQACGGDTTLVLRPSSPKQRRRSRRRTQARRVGEELPYLVLRVKERVAMETTTASTTPSVSSFKSKGRSLRQRV